jgi:hypothetical protein
MDSISRYNFCNTFSCSPEDLRPVILIEVSKSNGGIFSIFNLYRDVQFTVDEILMIWLLPSCVVMVPVILFAKRLITLLLLMVQEIKLNNSCIVTNVLRTVNALIEILKLLGKRANMPELHPKKYPQW